MADTTRLTIELETILRGLNKTLRGLSQLEKQLRSVASVSQSNRATVATQRLQQQQQRAALTAQRLAQQQQAVSIRAQQLANAQTRTQQTTQRLAQAQQRLTNATAATTTKLGQQANAHVIAFRAIQRSSQQATQGILSIGNALRSVGQGLASLGATLSVTVTAPLVAAGAASVDAAVQLDSLKRGLTAIVGSADEANRQLARLTRIAKLPGIGFEEAIQGSIRLQAVGFSAQEAEKNLREFANAVALTGGGREELTRVTVQLGQLAAKGKVLSQDLRPIIEAAPAVGRALLQAFGTVNADDIQALGLTTKQFLGILTDELEGLPRAAAGAKNSFENFRDEVFRAAAAVGEVLLPGLIRLAEVAGPAIIKLADIFARLPGPVQIVAIGVAGLLAALGPVLFVVGQLTLGVGRLLVGFVELNAAGVIPSIAAMRAYAAAALNAAAAQKTLGVSTVALGGVLGAVVSLLGIAAAAYLAYNAFQKDAVTPSKERADALTGEIDGLRKQTQFLNGLEDGVKRTADEQERLLDIYDSLNRTAKIRITAIKTEEERLVALREELTKVIALREQERIQQAASVVAELANNILKVQANEDERDSTAARIQANAALIETLEREQKISVATNRALAERGINASTVEEAIGGLKVESEGLSDAQDALIKSGGELTDLTKDEVAIVQALERQTGLTARELLVVARNMGQFRGDVAATIPVLERYVAKTVEAAKATDTLNRALSENERELNAAGARADAEAKRRQTIIASAAAIARETSVDFAGALKSLRESIAAVPELRAAFEREKELTGKSLEDLVNTALESAFKGRDKSKAGTGLRNAQQQLADALQELALASGEAEVRIEQLKNERLLQVNESAQRLRIISYREFLETRASLTSASIRREIAQQQAVIVAAKAAQSRLLGEAQKTGIPEAERVRRQTQATQAEEEAIKAQTRLTELQGQLDLIDDALRQTLREARDEQLKTVRELDIEFAELTNRVEDALNAATVERFREQLEQLSRAQIALNRQLAIARAGRKADEAVELEAASRLNQEQIDLIEGIVAQERATNRLTAAQRLIEQAKTRQSQLEQELSFEVENRGLSEEEAIRRRLEGEQRLATSLSLTRDIIRDTIDALNAQGVKPPQALVEFIREVDTEIRGLGELPFSEQFRLIEKEFNRLNDERLRRIADVERAVRNRDIAEVEGAIIIRRINGEYTDALELQLVLLKRIAEASGQEQLKRQAADAGEIVKDTRDRVADLGKQIDAAGKDATRSGLTDFFKDILNRTATAKEAVLDLVNSIATAINDVIAENLSKALFESIFGGVGKQAGGIVATVKRLFGFGGEAGVGAAGGIAASATQAAGTTAAVTALTTGATAAATALATGGATAAATLATSVTAAAASFSAVVIAAGAAFAASVGAATGLSSTGALSGSGIGNFAVGDILQPRPGGVIARIAEGGYPEAVLTTDPKYASRQAVILREFLDRTRGLGGRIKSFAAGAFVSPGEAQSMMLSGLSMPSVGNPEIGEFAIAGTPSMMKLRQVLVDQRSYRDWLTSSEGEQVIVDLLYRNQPVIRKLGGK